MTATSETGWCECDESPTDCAFDDGERTAEAIEPNGANRDEARRIETKRDGARCEMTTDGDSDPDTDSQSESSSGSEPDPSSNPVTLRPATSEDGEALVEVHVASIRELGPAAYDPEQVEAWAANKRPDRYPLEDESTRAVVADRESHGIVGFGWVDLEAGEVTAVYVHPDHARQGVGRSILEYLETAAREAGLESLGLTASVNAARFYERVGYEPVEHVDHDINGERLECVRMRTELDD